MSHTAPDSFPEDAGVPADDAADRSARRDEDLPPVKPPSAAFIVQLFLVPGLIVLAIVGVWALFGKMASSETDWQVLIKEIKQNNPHRSWRAAMGLAQLLKTDQDRGDEGQQLAANREVAETLAELFREKLDAKTSDVEELQKQAFLARALGMLDVPEVVLPVLQQAMGAHANDDAYTEVRKNAVASIAVIAGRAAERDKAAGDPSPGPRLRKVLEQPDLVDDVVGASGDRQRLLRQLGAYTLGLLPTPVAQQRLKVLAEDDAHEMTQLNAAIGLARQGSTTGLPVFKKVLKRAADEKQDVAASMNQERKTMRYFWIGASVFVLFVTAVWAFGTTSRGGRVFASLLCIGSIVSISWGVYSLVQRPATGAAAFETPDMASEDYAQHRRQARNEKFERLVMVRNTLKAVRNLREQLTAEQRSGLMPLLGPLAEEHPEPSIRIEARKSFNALRDAQP